VTHPILEITRLSKSYGAVVALDGVSLTVGPGEVVGLLGPNGAGKTTMVSIICGLRRADGGSVTVNGVDALAHPARARESIGLAPQDLAIYPVDTVSQNLALFGRLGGLLGSALLSEIDVVARALRLSDLMDRRAAELSGGQKRRLHAAIALLGHPPLILLDEATAGADVETRSAVISVVRSLAVRGSSVVYSTHYLQEVEALDARVVILDHGRVITEGSTSELVSSNGEAFVELTFRGRPPALNGRWPVTTEGSLMRVAVDDPGGAMAAIFGSLGGEARRLQSVEFVRPSLETVFLGLTGRRYEPEEDVHVVAS
jgi:ABC-2 type transport system ATP-binding protein